MKIIFLLCSLDCFDYFTFISFGNFLFWRKKVTFWKKSNEIKSELTAKLEKKTQ